MPKKYKTKVYECLDDIIDYNYEDAQIFRLENTRKRYNIKNFLKKQMNIVEKERPKHKTPDTDADLITNNVHVLYEMCKHWFLQFLYVSKKLPEMDTKIRKLEKENEILHVRLSKALLRLDYIDNSGVELPEEAKPEISAVDKILGKKYTLEDNQ